MAEQGGLGRYQKKAYFMIVLGMASYGFVLYGLVFLLLYPEFQCSELRNGQWVSLKSGTLEFEEKCKPSYFCDKKDTMSYQHVIDSHHTLDNWTIAYNLECAGKLVISAFGMSYFVGYSLGSLVIPHLSDKEGRKFWFLVSMASVFASCLLMSILPTGLEH